MAIRFCGLPLRAHPYLTATLFPWLSQCFRDNGKKIFAFIAIFLLVSLGFFTVSYQSHFHYGPNFQGSFHLWRGRKSIDYKYYDMRSNAQQMLDYSDPILVDLPVDSTGASHLSNTPQNTVDSEDLSYGVVIDCGSSGSRAFLYSWEKHSGDAMELLQIKQVVRDKRPVVMKITPGIATFASAPDRVESYLRPLVRFIKHEIPQHKQKETPLYVLCTAGMRMLTKKHQTQILDRIQRTFERSTNFQFSSTHVEVISGMTEGLYFWLAVNYMYGNLQQHTQNNNIHHHRPPTYGVLDMGGGSLQVAFEVSKKTAEIHPKNVMEIDIGCMDRHHGHEYSVFVDTFLHKGGNAVREMYERDLVFNYLNQTTDVSSRHILDPCLPLGFTQEVTLKSLDYGGGVAAILNGTGDFHACKARLLSYLDKSDCGDYGNCILNSRIAPYVNFRTAKFIGMSEFFYCMDDILQIGGAYNKQYYEKKASQFCATAWNTTWQQYNDGFFNADVNRMKFQCFKSAWVSVVLHQGLNFPPDYPHLTTVKHINGSEIHWTWGAILYKTRFLPLLEIQRRTKNEAKDKIPAFYFYPVALMAHSGVFLFACIVIALLYLFLSLVKFCLHARGIERQTLKRVGTSFAQFVNEEV